ncbi:hypothetical protein [uncultured Lamprocystis sp.]|jgi:hypothetical protein|uniref:hypothetical protein n=1 Tax=uncultured Lamprocystis sp. TaxID=543132 RepID=UPI0025DF7FB3|nr:hypothetical protein [uncultured Lamprocystis sp.]
MKTPAFHAPLYVRWLHDNGILLLVDELDHDLLYIRAEHEIDELMRAEIEAHKPALLAWFHHRHGPLPDWMRLWYPPTPTTESVPYDQDFVDWIFSDDPP